MAIIDKALEFSDAQAITQTAYSEVVDTVKEGFAYLGLWLITRVNTALASAGKTTSLTVELQTDDDVNFGTAVTLHTTGDVEEADLVKGKELIKMRLPVGLKRYLRLKFAVGAEENFTSGKIDAYCTPDADFPH